MEGVELAEYGFKLLVGISVPFAVKALADIRKSMEKLNINVAVLLEKDEMKDKQDERRDKRLTGHSSRLTTVEKDIITLKLALKGLNNDRS